MKTNLRKTVATILILVFCAGLTVTGFTISAAGHSNLAASKDLHTESVAYSALKDGVWQAVYEDDSSMLFFIDAEKNSFSLIHPDQGIGVPSSYEFISSIGMYKLHIGSADNEEDWRVIDNCGNDAAVIDANGNLITLYYLANETIDSYHYYTYDELCGMARAYCETHGGGDASFSARLTTDGSGIVTVTGETNGAEVARYSVNIETAIGTDGAGNRIDLNR